MGNLRDGGPVCIGIDDGQIAAMQPALAAAQLADWTDYDKVSAVLGQVQRPTSRLRDAHLRAVQRERRRGPGGRGVRARNVHVCKKSFPGVLVAGTPTCARAANRARFSPPTSADMHELHDLAVDKGVREFVRRAVAAGVHLNATTPPTAATGDVDREAFACLLRRGGPARSLPS